MSGEAHVRFRSTNDDNDQNFDDRDESNCNVVEILFLGEFDRESSRGRSSFPKLIDLDEGRKRKVEKRYV